MFFSARKKKVLVTLSLLLLALVVLPATLFFLQTKQNTKTKADKTVVLSFEPTSQSSNQIQIPAGGTFSLDVYLDPGPSSVSFVKTEITFDPAKFEPAGGFIPNRDVFSQVVENPSSTPGKIITTLSIGSDTSKAVKTKTMVGTVVLRALDTVANNDTATINFGSGSQALAISSNSYFDENVIANTLPAYITFNQINQSCGNSPSDTMLVFDKSSSMNEQAGTSGTKLSNAKIAASNFINILSQNIKNRVALTSFDNVAYLNSEFTDDYASVINQINNITAGSGTCIECGIVKANLEISDKKQATVKNAIIVLTDGHANHIVGNSGTVEVALAEQKALEAAQAGHTENDTVYYTIGLGSDVNSEFLTKLAEDSGGQYYYSPSTDQLNSIYTQISELLARGSVSGKVFLDTNTNGLLDDNEETQSGWLLQLTSSNNQIQTITSDSTGTFTFPRLCNGSYSLSEVHQSNWRQTVPANAGKYQISIANGSSETDKLFGNFKGTRCSDGIDNDGNGFIDIKDATCHSDGNPTNQDSFDPNIDGENGKNTCSDSKDNNGNGLIDGADPLCHQDFDLTKPWDPTLPEGTAESKLVCSPSNIILSDDGTMITATLQTISGAPIANKTITWSASPSAIAISPLSSVTDSTGKASASALVSLNNNATFNGTISAKFTSDTANQEASCVLQTSYAPRLVPGQLNVEYFLHGIGNSGDNANPANSLSNKNPLTTSRKTSVSLYDVTNKLVATASGDTLYNSTSGSYTGIITTNNPVAGGKYTMKITTDYHLTKLLPGILTVTLGQQTKLPSVHLVAGDANSDNRLDIRDYNLLLDCYSDLSPAVACTPTKKITTDGNDDNAVNQFDYNLFLREISTQPGE